jgi:hypothetical protein
LFSALTTPLILLLALRFASFPAALIRPRDSLRIG